LASRSSPALFVGYQCIAAPLYFADPLSLTFTDAVFESMSGLTTTGATVLTGLDSLPASILYYRQQLQWLGGMGIIVLAVAVLPMLGVGGMQLYRAEAPGPVKDTKLTPRITETAKALWYVYLAFTIACALGYRIAGMGWFDALCHAFSTVAIGGFSTHDASIAYFDSALVDLSGWHQFFFAFLRLALRFDQALFPGSGVQGLQLHPDGAFHCRDLLVVLLPRVRGSAGYVS
jgi:trk system potassium uptake protein TrkH